MREQVSGRLLPAVSSFTNSRESLGESDILFYVFNYVKMGGAKKIPFYCHDLNCLPHKYEHAVRRMLREKAGNLCEDHGRHSEKAHRQGVSVNAI